MCNSKPAAQESYWCAGGFSFRLVQFFSLKSNMFDKRERLHEGWVNMHDAEVKGMSKFGSGGSHLRKSASQTKV